MNNLKISIEYMSELRQGMVHRINVIDSYIDGTEFVVPQSKDKEIELIKEKEKLESSVVCLDEYLEYLKEKIK